MTDEYLTTALTDLADDYSPEVVLAEAHRLFHVAPSTPSRITDPETSIAAGERKRNEDVGRFSHRSMKGKLLRRLALSPSTAQEATAAVLVGGTPISAFDGCRRRVSGLLAAGFIEDSGDRRSNPGSSDRSIVWRLSPAGWLALSAMDAEGWTRPRRAA